MFYEEYLRYQNYYKKNIKKIKYKSHFYNLDKQNDDIKIKEMAGNFDLFFNREGQLCEIIIYKNKPIHAKFYYYENDAESNLYMVEESLLGNDYADTISEFCYDFKNRIALQKICHIHLDIEVQVTTVYLDNKIIEFYDNINDEIYSGYEVYTYENEELIQKTTYSKEREKIRDYKFNSGKKNNKDLEDFPQNFDLQENMDVEDMGEQRKYEYIYNKNNDWITLMVTDDGEPRYVIDREIDYYDL